MGECMMSRAQVEGEARKIRVGSRVWLEFGPAQTCKRVEYLQGVLEDGFISMDADNCMKLYDIVLNTWSARPTRDFSFTVGRGFGESQLEGLIEHVMNGVININVVN